jgi:hypothetical protein
MVRVHELDSGMIELTNGNPLEESIGSGRRVTLLALRTRLAMILDGSLGHNRHCECECGVPWDTGKVAGISRELREVIRELDDLPNESGGAEVASIAAQREKRRKEAQDNASEGE